MKIMDFNRKKSKRRIEVRGKMNCKNGCDCGCVMKKPKLAKDKVEVFIFDPNTKMMIKNNTKKTKTKTNLKGGRKN